MTRFVVRESERVKGAVSNAQACEKLIPCFRLALDVFTVRLAGNALDGRTFAA
jgi:hypothetical protein